MDLLVKFFVANSISNMQRFVSVCKSAANLHQIYIRSVTDPLPYHTVPYPTVPYHTMPCHAMLCHAMPCHAMPCHAMPCLFEIRKQVKSNVLAS